MANASGPLDSISQAYWDGVARNELVVQKCADCGRLRHYPQVLCPACHSFQLTHVSLPKAGTVHSWTVSEHSFDKEIAPDVPYTLVTVDMQEGIRILGRFDSASSPTMGESVSLNFEPNINGTLIPVFRPAGAL